MTTIASIRARRRGRDGLVIRRTYDPAVAIAVVLAGCWLSFYAVGLPLIAAGAWMWVRRRRTE